MPSSVPASRWPLTLRSTLTRRSATRLVLPLSAMNSPSVVPSASMRRIVLTDGSGPDEHGHMTSDGYRPLDLSAYRNVGVEVLAPDDQRLLGEQLLQGLPFDIGEGFIAP